jgi:cytochrome c553
MPQSLNWIVRAALAVTLTCTVAVSLVRGQAPAATAPAAAANSPTAPPASTAAAPAANAAAAASATTASATTASAAAAAPTPDPFTRGKAADGQAKSTVCTACHGANGNSTNPEWPRLAGQSAVYIAGQLRLFRSGVRNNPVMKPLASALSDQDIDDLAVYYEAQTPIGLEADPSYWKEGEALYLTGDSGREIPACVACHGPVGRGNLASGYPALRAQQSVYVVKQLNDYASGTRYSGPSPATATPNGIMMFTIAKRLSAEQIRDVASYVQGMR